MQQIIWPVATCFSNSDVLLVRANKLLKYNEGMYSLAKNWPLMFFALSVKYSVETNLL